MYLINFNKYIQLPDKRLIFFNSLVSPLDSKSRQNSNSQKNGAGVKYAFVQIANESDLMLINRLAHLCDVTIWNTKWTNINNPLNTP